MVNEKTFLIYRNELEIRPPRYDRFTIPITPGMTVLDALFYIQDHHDSTLAFRYACRGAICGSCGMTINKMPQLACKTQVLTVHDIKIPDRVPELDFGDVEWDKENEILIEPLPHMKVLKDLVVDMEPFWKFYKEVKPYFDKDLNDIPPETQQTPAQVKEYEHIIYCILCGLCWACPVSGKNENYLGPSALARSYRFISDSRSTEKHRNEIIQRVAKEDAVPACERVFACNQVCPQGVKPGTAINSIRTLLNKEKK